MKDTFPIPGAAAPGPPLLFPRGCRPWTPPLSADDVSSSTRTYCRTRQRVPVVASGGQRWPVGTKRCQRVPGVSGFNWPPLATSDHQWRPVAPLLGGHSYVLVRASGGQWWPVVARGGQLVPDGASGCQGGLASTGHHWPPVATSGDQWRCSSVGPVRTYLYAPAVASGGQWWPEVASWQQKVPEGARGVWLQLATTGHQ